MKITVKTKMAAWWCAACLLSISTPALAQIDPTLAKVRATGVASLNASREVFYSPGQQERAESLAVLLHEVDAYLSEQLGVQAEFSVAVLDEAEWAEIEPFPYGLPYVSLEAPWVLVLPASPELSVLFPDFVELLGSVRAADMVDNIAFHELGHVYTSAFVYPEDLAGAPPVRWLDEFLATYFAYAFLVSVAPERAEIWNAFVSATISGPRPRFTSLADFEAEYYGYLGSPEGTANYGWYQAVFAQHAALIYGRSGLNFLRKLRLSLRAAPASEWSTQSAVEVLEALAPGTHAWAERLGRPNEGAK
ncbi:MAG: hypothetical protein AAF098_02355 [Pseudomonadota bacterium]